MNALGDPDKAYWSLLALLLFLLFSIHSSVAVVIDVTSACCDITYSNIPDSPLVAFC